jgi:alpha-beta hydrolase superfamily lysophospholipase
MQQVSFTSAAPDAMTIFMRVWPLDRARGTVLIAHGAAEHGGRYARLAAALNGAGYAAAAVDHRGHGLTGSRTKLGVFGDADGWNRAVADLHQAAGVMRRRYPDAPLALLGHSMGSLMVQQYMAEHGNSLAAAILSGAMLIDGFEALVPAIEAEVARDGREAPCRVLAELMAGGGFTAGIENAETPFDWLSRDRSEVRTYVEDPLCGFALSAGAWLDLLTRHRIPQRAADYQRIPQNLPAYVFAGERDPVNQNLVVLQELLRRYAEAGMHRVSAHFYAGARHETLNEINRDEVTADLLAWLSTNLA